ncbi:Acyl-CoA dehydrogenase-like protein [Mycoavidus cysteinexigens]|uniref:Acyl-CoA dehydrogenase-like protein n=1 Tax=Mycoavidus cysteinexigens TaxID=1553431 RepID=A0A2Z6ETY2_9BURK|nr:hypothetical protein [Mycoavidus cysteinexigens]BBE08861.1 Acyl-CoA dehydrogenase-like protein [Mycoavidus cysteinexigens]GLR02204.1 hypothetical protein GCM10007934_20190 [Mycoavidus cysteinexigens]
MLKNTFDKSQSTVPDVPSSSRLPLGKGEFEPEVVRRRSYPIGEAFDVLTHSGTSQKSSTNRPKASRIDKTNDALSIEENGEELRSLGASPQYKVHAERELPSLNPDTMRKLVKQHRGAQAAKTWANQLDGAIQGTSFGEFVRSQFNQHLSLDEAQEFGAMVKQILRDKSAPDATKQLVTVPLLRVLAQVTNGDPDLAIEVLVRLGRPLDIGMHESASGETQIDQYAWRCAQQLAYERGPALNALLKLQGIDPAQAAQATLSKATRLTVYLQAAHKLHILEKALDLEAGASVGINAKAKLKEKPEAKQALAALKVACLADLTAKSCTDKTLNLAALEKNNTLKPDEIAAYWTWVQGFEENQLGSLLDKVNSRLLKAGKAWVARGQARAVLQNKIDQAPNWSFARLLARAELFLDDVPRAFNQKKTPYRTTEPAVDDELQVIYGETLLIVHSELCSYGEELLKGARNAEELAETAFTIAKIKQRIELHAPKQHEATHIGSMDNIEALLKLARKQLDSQPELEDKAVKKALELLDQKKEEEIKALKNSDSSASTYGLFSCDELEGIADQFFLGAKASETEDGRQSRKVMLALLKQAKQQAMLLNPMPLHEINPETLQAFQLNYINQTNGSRFEEFDGGRVGLGLGVVLKTHGAASVGLFARRTYGAEAAHAMSLNDAGLQLEFGKRQRKTLAVRGNAFFGKRFNLGLTKLIFGGGFTAGMNYQTGEAEHATLHALKSAGAQGDDKAWRDTAEKMVKNYWSAIESAQSDSENQQQAFLNVLARANFDDPNILLGNRNRSNTQVDLFMTASLGAYVALNPQSDSPTSIGLAGELTAKATPYSVGRETLTNDVAQGQQKRAGQASAILVDTSGRLLPGVGIPVETDAIKEVGLGGGLTRLRRIHQKLNTKKTVAEQGRHGTLHIMHNPQGIVPKLTVIDETFANSSHFKEMLGQDSRWSHLYEARLDNFIAATPNEKEAKPIFGVRWQLKDDQDLIDKINGYTHEMTQLYKVAQQTVDKAEKRTIKERIDELQSRVDGLFADPASWELYGLFKAREAKQGSSEGWKYIGWATHEHERTSVSDVEWLLSSKLDKGKKKLERAIN